MKNLTIIRGGRTVVTGIFSLLLMLLSFSASAQAVLANAQTGTIQLEAQDDGYLTISGLNFGYNSEITKIFLNGDEVGEEYIDEGLVVRYTLNDDGILLRIEVLGPLELIRTEADS